MGKFTVDTHLFRELGELLVGRDSTALVELIKNSYDADATRAVVYAEALTDPKRGYIEVADDGNGMTPSVFEEGFLRVASRLKASGARTSSRFQRRMTGEKGIGRLAAHKLAHVLEVTSIPLEEGEPGVSAGISWDEIEKAATFDELGDVPITELETAGRSHGTTIRLTGLRRAWTAADLGRFLAEVQTFEPPELLTTDLSTGRGLAGPLAVGRPVVRDQERDDPGFSVQLEGELARGDDYWEALWGEVDWVVEVNAQQSGVRYTITPTPTYLNEEANAESASFQTAHPSPDDGPFFHARILIREGRIDDAARRRWAKRISGVRVYFEGFRVLPYGEPGNDWVGIERRYIERTRDLPWLSGVDLDLEDAGPDNAGLSTPQASSVVGGVFLLEKQASSLRMLVNREGFVPEAGYYTMQQIVRIAMDLSTRVRAAASLPRRQARATQRREGKESPTPVPERPEPLQESFRRLGKLTDEAHRQLQGGDVDAASEAMKQATEAAERIAEVTGELISERSMLRVLASIGMQMAAFVHETNTTLRLASELEDDVNAVKGSEDVPRTTQRRLSSVSRAVSDLRRNIERQAAFLVDVVTPDARRRRSAQKLHERFEAATSLVLTRARRQSIEIENRIPADLKTPPMFPAEVATIFMNLLTNAIKAAGDGGSIVADGTVDDGDLIVTVANTGDMVDLAAAERWFRPFESTTVELDPVLGQGLGLGLPVTRAMVEEYGGSIGFVEPPTGYATAVRLRLPGARTA